jgi:hypothetical protein
VERERKTKGNSMNENSRGDEPRIRDVDTADSGERGETRNADRA